MLIRFLEQFGLDYEESVRRARWWSLRLSVVDVQTDYQFGQECMYEPCYYQADPTKVHGCMCEG